jgi:hypothetical protein
MPINKKSFDFLRKRVDQIGQGVSEKELQKIGRQVVKAMKEMIAKGQSPIKGGGRFKPYIAAAALRMEKKNVTLANRAAKDARKAGNDRDQGLAEWAGHRAKGRANRLKQRGYPFSVQDEFPDKKERPVNLYLSGDFMKSLESWLDLALKKSPDGNEAKIVKHLWIGFRDELSQKKEQGHREGANGQEKRPIIPEENEEFATSIQKIIIAGFREALKNAVKRHKGK